MSIFTVDPDRRPQTPEQRRAMHARVAPGQWTARPGDWGVEAWALDEIKRHGSIVPVETVPQENEPQTEYRWRMRAKRELAEQAKRERAYARAEAHRESWIAKSIAKHKEWIGSKKRKQAYADPEVQRIRQADQMRSQADAEATPGKVFDQKLFNEQFDAWLEAAAERWKSADDE